MHINSNNYIEKAHLPTKKVCFVSVSKTAKEIISALNSLNIKVLPVERSKLLPNGISEHSDILMHHLGDNKIICDLNSRALLQNLESIGFEVCLSQNKIEQPYPKDILLNCFALNNCLFANLEYTDIQIISHYEKLGYNLINVKQGYCKCSVLIVSEKAAITADIGLHNTMTKNGIDCLLINEGEITLEGYNYGFIGGCGGLIDKNLLAFTGDINMHLDREKIKAFLQKHSVKYICLTAEKLIDIGGIIPLFTV